MKNFDTAARRGKTAVNNPIDIEFQIDGESLTAHPPSSGQLALFMSGSSDGGMKTVRSMFDFMAAILDEADYAVLEGKLHDGIDLDVVTDIIRYVVEEWSARPTKPSSGSTKSRTATGSTSTVKRPSRVRAIS